MGKKKNLQRGGRKTRRQKTMSQSPRVKSVDGRAGVEHPAARTGDLGQGVGSRQRKRIRTPVQKSREPSGWSIVRGHQHSRALKPAKPWNHLAEERNWRKQVNHAPCLPWKGEGVDLDRQGVWKGRDKRRKLSVVASGTNRPGRDLPGNSATRKSPDPETTPYE